MPPRPSLPADDLYARLEVSVDASPEVIEVAWRSLLRRYHPDVAGPDGLERSKRINVAHDWLSDPTLRGRYDRERGLRRSIRDVGGRRPRDDQASASEGPTANPTSPRRPRRRPPNPAEALARFLEQVAALDGDEVDRLARATPAPIAFGATIERFLPPDEWAALQAMTTSVDARLAREAAARPGVRDAVEGFGTELVLGRFLDDLLSEPFRERTRERLTRGWEAAVGQPRYGPNGVAVRAWLKRLSDLDPTEVSTLARTVDRSAARQPDDPWPPGTSPADDEALRVSSILAADDAEQAVPTDMLDTPTRARARQAARRLAHLLVLRHAFAPATFASLTSAWRPRFLPDDRPATRVRSRRPAD